MPTKPVPGLRMAEDGNEKWEEKSWERGDNAHVGVTDIGHRGRRGSSRRAGVGNKQRKAGPRETICVMPFTASLRTGSTNLWGQNSRELGVCHIWTWSWSQTFTRPHMSHACALLYGSHSPTCVDPASASPIRLLHIYQRDLCTRHAARL